MNSTTGSEKPSRGFECDHPHDEHLKLGQYRKRNGKKQIVSVMCCEHCDFTYELVAKDWW